MMPEQPQNKAEELLQRYAQERREQGGDFSPHPATRQVLQGEVRRTLGARGGASRAGGLAWFSSWAGRFALGGTIAVVLVAAVWIFGHGQNGSQPMRMAKAEAPARELRATTPLAEPATSGEAKEQVAVDRVTLSDESLRRAAPSQPIPAESARDKRAAVEALALAPANGTAPAQLAIGERRMVANSFADSSTNVATFAISPSPDTASRGMASSLGASAPDANAPRLLAEASKPQADPLALDVKRLAENVDLAKAKAAPQLATRGGAGPPTDRARAARGNTPAPASAAAAVPAAVTASAPAERFSRSAIAPGESTASAPVAQRSAAAAGRYYRMAPETAPARADAAAFRTLAFKEVDSALPASAVLSSFVIEEKGDTLRIVDADGSVYDGQIEAPVRASADFDVSFGRETTKDAFAPEKTVALKSETMPRHEELSFRASGSNVTLRQLVVVSGRFVSETNGISGGFGGGAPAASRIQTGLARRAPGAPEARLGGAAGITTNGTAAIEGTVRVGTTNHQWFRATTRGPR